MVEVIDKTYNKLMNSEKSIFILGNGFDVAYGLKTKYSDFYTSTNFTNLINTSNLARFIDFENKKLQHEEKKWADLEEMLSKYSLYYLYQINQHDYFQKYSRQNLDIEEFGDFYDGIEISEDVNAKLLLSEYTELKKELYNYIQNQLIVSDINKGESLQKLVENWISTCKEYSAFTFNYTDTYLNILKKLKIDDSIKHLHGRIYDTHQIYSNDIVLGIDEDMKLGFPNHNFLYKSTYDNYHNTDFLSTINGFDKIIIFGCSLGISDKWYFENVFKNKKGKIFEIYYFGEDEKYNMCNRIKDLSGMSLSEFRNYNHLIWINTKSILNKELEYSYVYLRDSSYEKYVESM